MSYIDIVGYAAALAVLGSFCMSTIVPLRILAVVSNVLFGASTVYWLTFIQYSSSIRFCFLSIFSSLPGDNPGLTTFPFALRPRPVAMAQPTAQWIAQQITEAFLKQSACRVVPPY